MTTLTAHVQALAVARSGATSIEYALIAASIGGGLALLFSGGGFDLASVYQTIGDNIQLMQD